MQGARTTVTRLSPTRSASLLQTTPSPSMNVSPSDLSRRLGASRTPVRMALKLLHAEGLLTKLEGRGYRTRQFSEEAHLMQLKSAAFWKDLPPRELARKGLSSLNRERLDKSVEATGAIVNRGIIDNEAIEAFTVANLIFHRTIMQGSDNPFIEDCLRRLKVMPDSGVGEVLGSDGVSWSLNRIIVSHSQHVIIKKAIEAGDGTRAFNMMREHSARPLSITNFSKPIAIPSTETHDKSVTLFSLPSINAVSQSCRLMLS